MVVMGDGRPGVTIINKLRRKLETVHGWNGLLVAYHTYHRL